ncbi:MAG: hypothetical protein Q8M92_08475, partial [Candidatus Subteraquimicrobiales bacterium]|nr:hypothetical protein [Candidatus Subteraquimicrobiales bacterium]
TKALSGNDTQYFQEKFAEIGGEYLSTKIREESIAEKILDVRKIDENHAQVQRDLGSDTFYYFEEIEQDGIAMEVAMRSDAKPYFVNGKVYTIRPGKIESDYTKKPKMELRVSKNIVNFLKINNADAIRRVQDTVFMRTVRAGLGLTGTVIGADPTAFETYDTALAVDWTENAKKKDLVNLMNEIVLKELMPVRWCMSTVAYNVFQAMDSSQIGDLSGNMLTEGFSGDLLKMPAVKTIKSTLADNLTGNRFFDHTDESGNLFSDIYLFVDASFLGKLIKVDDDAIWSKWEKDIFEWMSWRYCGLGFGDVRGIGMMRVLLREGPGRE